VVEKCCEPSVMLVVKNPDAIADFCADLVSGEYCGAADCYGRVGIELVPCIVHASCSKRPEVHRLGAN